MPISSGIRTINPKPRAIVMKTAPYLLPLISPRDYDAFSRLNDTDLPDTYEEWLRLHAEMKSQSSVNGYIVEAHQIEPREFVRYCSPRGMAPNRNSLLIFVGEKAAGRKY
jgi:hypothetical protein